MAEEETSESEAEETSEELENPVDNGRQREGVVDYEKQRLSRIAENRARMEALGLPKMASSLMGSSRNLRSNKSKGKGKAKVVEDDEDYRPEEEGLPSSSSEEVQQGYENDDDEDEDEDYLGANSSALCKNKLKKKCRTSKKKVPAQKTPSNSDYMDDDEALRQAIALSLQASAEASSVIHSRSSGSSDKIDFNINERKKKAQIHEDMSRRKRKKTFASRLQMTEDELLVHFYQFDDEWKGGISIRDVERVANAHDFTWTDKELADMISCFDSDGDAKLSLDDFQKIATRCNLIKQCEDS